MKMRRVIVFLTVAASVLVLAVVLTIWFMTRGCGGNEEAARSLRALPQERLSALYDYIRTLDMGRTDARSLTMSFPPDPIPQEIADLNPKFLQVSGDMTRMHISGCSDDKVYLFFRGLGTPSDSKAIVLSPGEVERQEILWEQ